VRDRGCGASTSLPVRFLVVKRIAVLLLLSMSAASCGGGGAAPPAASVDVDDLISRAADAMASLESARFTMERSGAVVEVAGLEFATAEGQYAAPSSARAILGMKVGDLSVDIGTIAIEDRVWLTNPLTGGWEEITGGTGFNIAVIFDSRVGWVPLLTDDLSGIEYLGMRDGGEGSRHVIHGTIAASRIEFLTAGLVEAQSVESDIWLHPESGHITRVEFETTMEAGVSRWVIEMSDFDAPVTIDAPAGA